MNANLWLTQLLSVLVFLRHPRERRMFVRHEDFLADPEGCCRQILERVGSDAELPDLGALTIGSPLQGNRLIRSEQIALEPAPRGRRPGLAADDAPAAALEARARPDAPGAARTRARGARVRARSP